MALSKKSFVFGVVSLAALGLIACGDDSGNGFAPTNGDQVSSIYELGQCSAEKEGVSVLVTDENTYYLCTSSEWKPVAEYNGPVSSSTLTPSSSSTPIEDRGSSSSVKGPEQFEGSSSSVTPSGGSTGVEGSSSSIASSSSEDLSCSSSVKSSSSVASSSSAKSSSSKANWAYLNPNIDYGEFTDERDGQVYKTVKIGTQTWMAENLNYDPGDVSSMGDYAWSGCYGDGGYDYSSFKNLTDEKVAANCSKYGRLYTWEVAMDKADCAYGKTCNASLDPTTPVRGVCPSGWHLPSHREFETLINYVDPSFGYNHTSGDFSSKTGMFLKSKSGWTSDRNGFLNGNGTDVVGFSALPGGYRDDYGDFYQVGLYAYFLSSGEYNSYEAFSLRMGYHSEVAYLDRDLKFYAVSVRCLRD